MNTVALDRNQSVNQSTTFSPRIQSLIGIIPPFTQEEIDSDERLNHILNHKYEKLPILNPSDFLLTM